MIYKKYFKRILDIVLSGIALIVLSPVYLVLCILVRIKLGRPVFFTQERPGLHGKIFRIYKFRTMTDARDEQGNLLPDVDRLTDFGRSLRASSLDELPEFWNVLIGDMSIVGPRPLEVHYLPYYNETERLRHEVRPGITGLAQINGRNSLSWDEKFKYDVDYVNNLSFEMDLGIFIRTVFVVISHKDIGQGEEIPEDFAVVRQAEWNKSGKK